MMVSRSFGVLVNWIRSDGVNTWCESTKIKSTTVLMMKYMIDKKASNVKDNVTCIGSDFSVMD